MDRNEEIESVDRTLMSTIHAHKALADNAAKTWNRKRRLAPEEKLARFQRPLDPKISAPFSQLLAAGIRCYWQYLAMSETAFEAAVSDPMDRLTIAEVMSNLGFVRGVPFTEEMRRTLQDRPQNVFATRPDMANIMVMPVDAFMAMNDLPLVGSERSLLKILLNCNSVRNLIGRSPAEFVEVVKFGSQPEAVQLAAKVERAFSKIGLWFNFVLTKAEQDHLDNWIDANLP